MAYETDEFKRGSADLLYGDVDSYVVVLAMRGGRLWRCADCSPKSRQEGKAAASSTGASDVNLKQGTMEDTVIIDCFVRRRKMSAFKEDFNLVSLNFLTFRYHQIPC